METPNLASRYQGWNSLHLNSVTLSREMSFGLSYMDHKDRESKGVFTIYMENVEILVGKWNGTCKYIPFGMF